MQTLGWAEHQHILCRTHGTLCPIFTVRKKSKKDGVFSQHFWTGLITLVDLIKRKQNNKVILNYCSCFSRLINMFYLHQWTCLPAPHHWKTNVHAITHRLSNIQSHSQTRLKTLVWKCWITSTPNFLLEENKLSGVYTYRSPAKTKFKTRVLTTGKI